MTKGNFMIARRATLGLLAISMMCLPAGKVGAQGRDRTIAPEVLDDKQSVPCPECDKLVEFDAKGSPPAACPHCKAKIKIEKKGEEGWTVKSEAANPLKKILLIVGGVVLGLALLFLILKLTVFKPTPPPKKKKKKRRDDYDEVDDRPRKRKRPVVEDDEEERPRKVRKPRIVEDDED